MVERSVLLGIDARHEKENTQRKRERQREVLSQNVKDQRKHVKLCVVNHCRVFYKAMKTRRLGIRSSETERQSAKTMNTTTTIRNRN